jgi:XTP/dITP diphosphohydrolase
MNIVLATRNPSKVEQIRALFLGSKIQILSLDDAGIKGQGTEEDGTTLENNARLKAVYAHEHRPDLWSMADDTGLFIRALGGAPGVDAAVWAGKDVPTQVTTDFCLAQMKGVEDRFATWRTVAIAVSPSGEEFLFTGELNGHMLEIPRVPPQPKMPYSALLVPLGETLTFAEMTTEYENHISHRGQAFRKLRSFLESRA